MKKNKPNPLDIDIYDLHQECRKQSAAYKKWANRHANAVDEMDRAKSAMELSYADLMLKINKRPGKYGLDKTTGPLLESAIIVQPEYQQAVDAYHTAKHNANELKGMVDAMSDRKKMLELEVQLWFGSYFADPKVKAEPTKRRKKS